MKTNFEKLLETKYLLELLSNKPFEEIISSVEGMFIEQVPDTKMLSFEITSSPQWLTGVKKNKGVLVRIGLAVACDFILQNGNGIYDLSAVFSWVGINLDSKPVTKIWIDLDGTLEEFGDEGILQLRIYDLD